MMTASFTSHLPSHSLYLQRLCSGYEVDVLTNVDVDGTLDVRRTIVASCEKAVEEGPSSSLFLGEYTASLAYSILMSLYD